MNDKCIELENQLASAAFGDADFLTKRKIKAHLKACPACRKKYEEMKIISSSLGSVKLENCPASVEDKIYNVIKNEGYVSFSFLKKIQELLFKRQIRIAYALSIIFAVVFTIAYLSSDSINLRNRQAAYTDYEIQTAEKQVKETLALVGKIINKTQSTVEEEIITQKVVKPIGATINSVNKLFINGENQ